MGEGIKRTMQRLYHLIFGDGQGAYHAALNASDRLDDESAALGSGIRHIVRTSPNPALTLARNMRRVGKENGVHAH